MWINSPISEEIFSNEEFDRAAAIREILTEDYPRAKEAILKLEVYIGKRSERAVYELRDSLDHIATALRPETDPSTARRHLAEVRTHFRRAMVEPVEYLAEATLLEVEELLKKKLLLDILCIPFPDKHALEAEMRPIADAIVKGRNSKGSEDSLIYMQSALDMVTALRDKLRKQARPDRWHDRMFAIRFGVVTLTVGAFLGLGLKVGYDHLTKTPVHQEPANNPKGVP